MEVYENRSKRNADYFASRMRCWCKKPVVREGGKSCDEYRGDDVKLSVKEIPILFPHKGMGVCCGKASDVASDAEIKRSYHLARLMSYNK